MSNSGESTFSNLGASLVKLAPAFARCSHLWPNSSSNPTHSVTIWPIFPLARPFVIKLGHSLGLLGHNSPKLCRPHLNLRMHIGLGILRDSRSNSASLQSFADLFRARLWAPGLGSRARVRTNLGNLWALCWCCIGTALGQHHCARIAAQQYYSGVLIVSARCQYSTSVVPLPVHNRHSAVPAQFQRITSIVPVQ